MSEITKTLGMLSMMLIDGKKHDKESLFQFEKAMEEHKNLLAEIERLKKDNEKLYYEISDYSVREKKFSRQITKAEEQLKQYQEALKRCIPNWNGVCRFCRSRCNIDKQHKSDCEYIKLCGG